MSNALDITMDQGSTLIYNFNLSASTGAPLDLTGFDARMQVRAAFGASSALINCTLPNGKLTITNATQGALTLQLQPTDTSSIRFPGLNDDTYDCVYDLEIVDPVGNVYKPARGNFTINREVTR